MQTSKAYLWIEASISELESIFNEVVKGFGFVKNVEEPCVYKKASGIAVVFLVLYVDDILLIVNDIPMLEAVKSSLKKSFLMKDLGEAVYILGIKIYRDR
jgi:hypothetical protein